MSKHLIAILFLCFLGISLRGQQTEYPIVTARIDTLTIEQALLRLENQTGYRFYYDTAQLDTTKIILEPERLSLPQVVEKLLEGTGLQFAIDQHKNVFIARNLALQTRLPDSFFDTDPANVATELNEINPVPSAVAAADDKIYNIGRRTSGAPGGSHILNGYVRDAKTGEPIPAATVQVAGTNLGTVTDQFGYYTLSVPAGRQALSIQSLNMEDANRRLMVYGSGTLNIDMAQKILSLKNVVISAEKTRNVRGTALGMQQLDIQTIKQVPVVFGEADIMRVVLTTPGVKTVGEASTGLNVRGGSADQNLVLFNDMNIYNPAHFFGLFSAFNPEMVQDVELYKGSIPSKFGGRASAVVNITSREGNKKNFAGSAGIGLLTSRLNIEGPIVKDKSSFIAGGRTTYANWLLDRLPGEYRNSEAGFYDLNLVISHEINKKNTLYLTGYTSNDRFNLNSDTMYRFGNYNGSLKWKHTFSNKLFAVFTTGYDQYEYSISSDKNPISAYDLSFNIQQGYFKAHFNYFQSAVHTLEFGVNSNYHKLNPGSYLPVGNESLVNPTVMNPEQALESAVYLSDKFNITPSLTLESGIRYSLYNYLGPADVNKYPENLPKTSENLLGTDSYSKGKVIHTYQGPEFRLGIRQMLSGSFSVKAGYNSLRQYIHMLSNTAAMAPTDIWKLSDPNIRPQFSDQLSLGVFKNVKENTIELSLEGYYKRIRNYLDFKSGAILVMNPHVETDVMHTQGKAYGAEFMAKKLTGKLNGWISYTYSRILLKADQASTGEMINDGKYYPSNYDKPHDVTVIGNYRVSHRFSVSLNGTYSTGRPITLPIGRYYYAGGMRTLYGDRNGHRIPDYFRLDASMNIEGNHKLSQKTKNSWTIGVYNITARRNPYSVYYVSENGLVKGYKLSIFGTAIPYINFNIRFN